MSEEQPIPAPLPEHTRTPEEIIKAQSELKTFGEQAKIGTARLKVIDDMQQLFQARVDVVKAQLAPPSEEKNDNIIIEKLNERMLKREIMHKRVTNKDGYNEDYKELDRITMELRKFYAEGGKGAGDADRTISQNLYDLRDDGLNRGS